MVVLLLAALLGPGPAAAADDATQRPGTRFHDVVTDPRGDVHHPLSASRGAVRHRHADILRTSYTTPSRPGGAIRVAVTWAQLRDGSGGGVRQQQQLTMMQHPATGATWFFWLGNASGPAHVFASGVDGAEATRVRPRTLDVERVPGVGGRTIVRLSTEWLPVGRLRFFTFSQSRDAVDDVDPSVLLDVTRR